MHYQKIGMLTVLLAGVLSAQTFESQQNLDFRLWMASPLLHVASYEIGALDLSYGRGIVGSYLNPAALARGDGARQVYVGVSLPKGTQTFLSLPILTGDTEGSVVLDLEVPTTLDLQDAGGLDFLGIRQRLGSWHLGAGFWAPERSGGRARGTFALTSPVSFDSVPTQYVSDDGDTVNIVWQLTGYGQAGGLLEGSLEYRIQPFFLRVARRFGPLSVGMGYDLERLEGTVDLAGHGFLQVDSLHTVADSAFLVNGQPVTVAGEFQTILADTVFRLDSQARASALRHGFGLGLQADFWLLKMGIAGRVWLPTTLNLDRAEARMIRTSGMPDSVYYSPSTRLSSGLDTLYLTDTLGFSRLRKDTLEFFKSVYTRLPLTYTVGAGVTVGPLHLSGVADLVGSGNRGFGRYALGVALMFPIPAGKLVLGYGHTGTYLLDRTGTVVPLMSQGSVNFGGTVDLPSGLEVGGAVKLNPMALGFMFRSPLQEATEVQRPKLSSVLSLSFGISKTWR